jgi:hypothetical protein
MHWDIPTYSHLSDKSKNKGHCSYHRRRCILIFGIISAFIVFNGCATVATKNWYQDAGGIPPKHELKTVPFYPQKEYQCGPASLAMALSWSGLQIDLDGLTAQVFTPSLKGSLPPAMVAATRRHGRVAYPVSGASALLKEIAAGHPVIVLQNLGFSWIPRWHYAVVIGYDLDEGVIILHSGVTDRKRTYLKAFANTWARSDFWGLAVLPPYRLPASADETTYVLAIVGLEKDRQFDAAAIGYQTALNYWPNNLSAHIGLSNSLYAQGKLKFAETVLRKTTDLFPNAGVAFNNLAQVLWDQGKKQEAIKTARRAVRLGGPFVEKYRQTLDEFREDEAAAIPSSGTIP